MLAALSLTTPLLLSGLALLALPLIAHWLHRQSRRTIVFPSIALLMQTVAQQSRLNRLKRWILLALRLLAVACIVLAFTRPVWTEGGAGAPLSDEQSAAVVLLVDVSASSGQMSGGVVELEHLKGLAGRVLDDLRTGVDVAGLVVADAAPRSVFPRLTANLGGLRGELSRLAPTADRADVPAALAAAQRLLATHAGPGRLVVVSDLQRDNWSEILARGGLGEGFPEGSTLQVLPRPGAANANVALARPGHFPPAPIGGEPFDLSVQVRNHSDAPKQVRIRCERRLGDGSEVVVGQEELTVTLEPREDRSVQFRVSEFTGDRLFARFDLLTDDALSVDNQAWHVVQPALRQPVLVVSDDDPRQPGTAAYYLLRALAPDDGPGSRFEPRHLRSADVTAEALAGVPTVVTGYLGWLAAPQGLVLREYVERGGGLLVFCGEGGVDRNLATLEAGAGEGRLLPWRPGSRRGVVPSSGSRHLGGGRWQSRWLRSFDEQSQLALQEIPFHRTWTAGPVAPETEVLLNFDDASPALGVRSVGRGLILVANFSPESTTSDLARHGAFVALTQMLLQGAAAQVEVVRQPLVGASHGWRARFAPEVSDELSVIGPTGTPMPLSSRPEEDRLVVATPRLLRPGIYQLRQGASVVEAVACGVDPREGDLARLPATDLEQAFRAAGTVVTTTSTTDEALAPLRGQPLWGECFAAALGLIGLELLLLGLWRR